MTTRYNIAIVGKTGVGKSTLINYLYGDNVVKTGVGKSVTKNGFHPTNFEINGLPVTLFDSWGLEIGKDEEWMKELKKELKERGTDKSAEKWFHSVFYCIAANGHRIEDFDIKIIRHFISKKYKVSVIFTKADGITQEEGQKLVEDIRKEINKISTILVCSEEKELYGGIKTKKFGKEQIEQQAYNDFWDSIILRLPERCEKRLRNMIFHWRDNQKYFIENYLGFFKGSKEEIQTMIKQESDKLIYNMRKNIIEEVIKTLKMYNLFSKTLGYPPASIMNIGSFFNAKFPRYMKKKLAFAQFIDDILEKLFNSNEKDKLKKYVSSFSERLLNKIPEVKSQIKNILEDLKEGKTQKRLR